MCKIGFCVDSADEKIKRVTVTVIGLRSFFAFSNILTKVPVVESVQDFLIKLDIKPLMHLLEISTFSLNNVIVRLTKIMNRANKNWAHF